MKIGDTNMTKPIPMLAPVPSRALINTLTKNAAQKRIVKRAAVSQDALDLIPNSASKPNGAAANRT